MPRRPEGEKRPADAIGNAVMIAKIATGEIEDITTEDGKNAAAVALGRMGGKARAEGMTPASQRNRQEGGTIPLEKVNLGLPYLSLGAARRRGRWPQRGVLERARFSLSAAPGFRAAPSPASPH